MLWLGSVLSCLFFLVDSWPTEEPFWPHYPARKIQVLDGEWMFGFDENADPLAVKPHSVKTSEPVIVPHSFDVSPPGEIGRRGTAFYRTRFFVGSHDTPLLLYFTACSFYCRVFLDNEFLGEHRAGGYQPFWIDATSNGGRSSARELFVVVYNKFNSTLAPTHTGGDFYFYGGITRSVIIHELASALSLKQVETFTTDYEKGIVDIRIVFSASAAHQRNAVLLLSFDGMKPEIVKITVENGVAWIRSYAVPFPRPWNLNSPNLHTLRVTLLDKDKEVDAIEVRFGLRIVTTKMDKNGNARIAINDQIVKLHGVNRHTMWPDTGAALTRNQVEIDIELLVNLGVNYVRGAHYPQDPRFLDLCDEVGIVVWEETLGPDVSLQNITNPYFMKYQIDSANEMIDASINHPSVIFHGFFNEGPSSHPSACAGYNSMAATIRSRVGSPPSRLVTWASDKRTNDACLDSTDLISFNAYPAWYDKPQNLTYIDIFWKSQVDWVKNKFPQKAFTISETGAGGIFEWRNRTDIFWSQEYMAEVVGLGQVWYVGPKSKWDYSLAIFRHQRQ